MNNQPLHREESSGGLHVVFGGTGAYGYAIVKSLLKKGAEVRAVVRNLEKAENMMPEGVQILKGDILDAESVANSCRNASTIYFCNNFPYSEWGKHYLYALENVLKGIEHPGTIVVFPGNVYGYGLLGADPVYESHLLNAVSRKGKIRNAMESLLMEYHNKGRIHAVIPRFTDFYGPNVTNDLYGAMFRNALKGNPVLWPLNADMPHSFTYVEDAAEASLLLADDPETFGQVFHVTGALTTARKFIAEVYQALEKPLKIRVISKGSMRMMSLLNRNVRELMELLYEYGEPYNIDDSKFTGRYPSFRHTPYEIGIKNTLKWFEESDM